MPLCCVCSAAFETHNTIFYLHRILELSASLTPELRLPGREMFQSDAYVGRIWARLLGWSWVLVWGFWTVHVTRRVSLAGFLRLTFGGF